MEGWQSGNASASKAAAGAGVPRGFDPLALRFPWDGDRGPAGACEIMLANPAFADEVPVEGRLASNQEAAGSNPVIRSRLAARWPLHA